MIDPQSFLEEALKKLGRETGRIEGGNYIETVEPEPQPGFADPFETTNQTRTVQTRPAVEEPLLPGRDAMIMRNIMRASMPEAEPTIQAPLPATQQPGQNVTAAINQPTENANPRIGETRLIQGPKDQGYVLQYFTGDKNLGWQSREALQEYVKRAATLGATSEPVTERVVESATSRASRSEAAEPKFGQKAELKQKDVYWAGKDYGWQSRESIQKVKEGLQRKAAATQLRQFAKPSMASLIGFKGV